MEITVTQGEIAHPFATLLSKVVYCRSDCMWERVKANMWKVFIDNNVIREYSWKHCSYRIMSNFSFCHYAFKSYLLQMRQNESIFGKRVNCIISFLVKLVCNSIHFLNGTTLFNPFSHTTNLQQMTLKHLSKTIKYLYKYGYIY